MPSPKKPKKTVPVTVKLPATFAAELRAWVARERGRPLYLASLSAFAEQAFRREMQRLDLVVAGALPLDRTAGGEPGEEGPSRRSTPRPINSHT
jgi:hypothetical protein